MNESNLEYLVIGALLKFPELYGELALSPEMFSDGYANNVMKYINEQNRVDKNDIYIQAKKLEAGFMPTELMKQLVSDKYIMKSHFTNYQIEVLEKYKERKLAEATENYSQDRSRQSLDYLKSTIDYLDKLDIKKMDTKKEVVDRLAKKMLEKEKPILMKTGFTSIDNYIGGFKPGQLVIVGARPSVGKSAFALNLATQLEKNEYNVSFVSLEMTDDEVVERIISARTLIDLKKFENPDSLSEEELEKYIIALEGHYKSDLKVVADPTVTPADIRRLASTMQQESEKNVIVIDYLSLMSSDGRFKDRRLEVEDISRKLKVIALEYKCTVIALSQLSRGVESRNDKRPMMSDLRETGGIEQDADIVFMLHRDDYYDRDSIDGVTGISETECIIAKNRSGATGIATLNFHKKIQRFVNQNAY
ncbi:DnaB-like helicase C-terminal domain-containing protein [Macrococcoides caseolyticum]|uniref:DnaB-like helicase C-terminal domain-containing protein n=1 Tax=Macrococcoides caseolyticum TaxID=69966 RepID=UPI000C3486C3|nr:DnaB-like helicase C-terminal domain-containing protein [Macrococcus caseolyticus]PKE18690.1 damage-inducible protein [Macrococcus caseolyticus]PKF41660.1 damage-inducible protein [Macrococcus caseolyticus]